MRKAAIHGFTAPYLYIRGNGNYLYRRAIPAEHQRLAGGRTEFKESLRTRSHNVAVVRYGETHSKYEAIFEQLRNGIALKDQKVSSVEELKARAASLGLAYRSAEEQMSKPDMKDLARRLGTWTQLGKPSGVEMDAIFGTLPNDTTLRQALAFHEEQNRTELIGLTPREASKKLTPVRAAIERFITFADGDLPLRSINRTTANAYRSHLIQQIEAGSIQANTANKLLMHVRKVISFYIQNMDEDFSNLLQGYRRGWIGTIFLTCGLSMLAMIAGLFVMLLFAGLISDVLFRIPNNEFLEKYGGWFMAATAGLTLFGMMIGLFRRRGRLRRFAAIEHNEAFLAENGFKETAGRDVTHYDADGNALRFLEASPDRLSFMVVGRRGRRAYIDLDENGRMLSYSGIV